MTLQQLDAFAPIPDHLIGRYDVVHLRLFCTIVREDDAAPLVANLTKMLSKQNTLPLNINNVYPSYGAL